MPIYEYGCESCESVIERLESFESSEALPECCGTAMRKLISAAQLHQLKGTGFYATEWGNQQHHLEPRDQAIRASRECKERHLAPNKPRPVRDSERKGLEEMSNQ